MVFIKEKMTCDFYKENNNTINLKKRCREEESVNKICNEIFQYFEELSFNIFANSQQILTSQIPNQITDLLKIAGPKDDAVKEMRKNICELFKNAYLQKLQFFKEDLEKVFPMELKKLIKKNDAVGIEEFVIYSKMMQRSLQEHSSALNIVYQKYNLKKMIGEFSLLDTIINNLKSATPKVVNVIAHTILTKLLHPNNFENEEAKDAWEKVKYLLIPSCKPSSGGALFFDKDDSDSEPHIDNVDKKVIMMKYTAPQFDYLFHSKSK